MSDEMPKIELLVQSGRARDQDRCRTRVGKVEWIRGGLGLVARRGSGSDVTSYSAVKLVNNTPFSTTTIPSTPSTPWPSSLKRHSHGDE